MDKSEWKQEHQEITRMVGYTPNNEKVEIGSLNEVVLTTNCSAEVSEPFNSRKAAMAAAQQVVEQGRDAIEGWTSNPEALLQ